MFFMKEKILIINSDNVLSKSIENKLKDAEFQTEIVENGNDAIEKIKIFYPDLILINLFLNGKSGYEILNEKSYDRFITKIPVIIVSNSGTALEMKKIPSNPTIVDFIIKTHIDPEEVLISVEKALGKEHKIIKEVVSSNNGKKILWVEDDKLLSLILSKKLLKSGFDLLKAVNSTEAFAILEKEIPDIIVLDILLPGMNGLDILQKIKMQEKLRKIPTIILSNMNSQTEIDKAKLLGANRFIVKAAVSLEEIVKEIEALIV